MYVMKVVILNRVDEEGLTEKVLFEQSVRYKGLRPATIWGKSILNRRNSKYKDPEMYVWYFCEEGQYD